MAGLYLRRVPQVRIAAVLGVSRVTIGNDVKHLESLWRKELLDDPVSQRTRELAELDEMEQEAALIFDQTKDIDWWQQRLKAKEFRAKLLGLFSPIKSEHTLTLMDLLQNALEDADDSADQG